MLELNEDRLKEDEYEKQYYGFSSTELYEDFKEQVCKAVKLSLIEMQAAFKEQKCDNELQNLEIKDLYLLYMNSAEVPLQKFKDEARKIFAIPKNVVLDEDKYNTEHYSDKDIIQLKQEVAELEKELLREQIFLAKCKQQKEIMDTVVKPVHEKVESIIKSLKNVPENLEIDENEKKLLNLHEQHIQYYFNNDNMEIEQPEVFDMSNYFIKNPDDFFK